MHFLRKISQLIQKWRFYDAKSFRELRQYATPLLSETRVESSLRRFDIGQWTYGVPDCRYQSYGNATLKIGKFCSIAPDVRIFLAGEHQTDCVTSYPFSHMFLSGKVLPQKNGSKGSVVIGNDVWIGDGVLILSGVTIGDGAVIAARAIVSHDVAPYSIVGGVPAKLIRMRFTPEVIAELLRISWWDWPVEKINQEISVLGSSDVTAFINTHKR